MGKRIYLSFEDAVEEEIHLPLSKAHLSVKDYRIQDLANALISYSQTQEAYVVRQDRSFWEVAEEFAIE